MTLRHVVVVAACALCAAGGALVGRGTAPVRRELVRVSGIRTRAFPMPLGKGWDHPPAMVPRLGEVGRTGWPPAGWDRASMDRVAVVRGGGDILVVHIEPPRCRGHRRDPGPECDW